MGLKSALNHHFVSVVKNLNRKIFLKSTEHGLVVERLSQIDTLRPVRKLRERRKPMKTNHVIIFAMIHICASVIAFAKECPDEMRIDKLPVGKTFLTVMDDSKLTPKNSTYDCHSGECMKEPIIRFKNFVSFSRYLDVGIQDNFVNSLQGETYIYQGMQRDYWSKSKKMLNLRLSFLNVKYKDQIDEENSYKRSEIRIYQKRSILDPRSRAFTYGSMKYNLGSTFKITAECD